MTPKDLRTLTLFEAVDDSPEINQRQLAHELDISLGLTNAYIQRVLKKGWIRAKQVKARRWLYFLTPQGAIEKSRLSISYMQRTLDSFKELKLKGDQNLLTLMEEGVQAVHLCGDTDLMEVISFCFSGVDIELKSSISESDFLQKQKDLIQIKLPALKANERILLMSLENQTAWINIFKEKGLHLSEHWEIFR